MVKDGSTRYPSNYDFKGVISGNGQFIKTGSGTLSLYGANAHLGGTIINGGTIKSGAAGVLPDNGLVQLANASGAALNLNNNNETIAV